jgi:hypothetical protein
MLLNIEENELDKKIYRVLSLERLQELFVTGENTFVKPSKWEDTFENFILKSKVRLRTGDIVEYNYFDRMYGQCWTLHKASDAMWRIYSSDKQGLRIRTTIRKLIDSLTGAHSSLVDVRCAVGKVEYLRQDELMAVANKTFDDSGIATEDIFRSLLLKRKAFIHEKEVRALYMELDDDSFSDRALYKYEVDPQNFVSQIMIDPRRSYAEFKDIEREIRKTTGFKGEIKRSLLYTLPKDITLDVTDIFS